MNVSLIPWAVLIPALGLIGKLWLDNRRLRIAEREAAQRIHEAGVRLMMEAADTLSHAPQHAHDRTECINLVVAWIRAETRADWLSAERNSVEFLKRMGAGDAIAGVRLSSETEERE